MKKTSSCLYCGKSISFYDTQTTGKYCSNQCQIDIKIEKKLKLDTSYGKGIRSWCYRHLKPVCWVCQLEPVWNMKPLRLQVDHINGNVRDNRKENLRMICPNCHTQTETWGVKNASENGWLKMVDAGRVQSLKFSGGVV